MTASAVPAASVITPCRNESARVTALLRTLADQDFSEPLEVIVADGESDDDTWQRLVQFRDSEDYPFELVLIRNAERDIPHALNHLVRRARGELILRIDAHTLVMPTHVSQLVAALRQGDMDVVGARVALIPGGEGVLPWTIACVLNSRLGNGGTPSRNELDAPVITEHTLMSGYRREVWETIGGYDEHLKSNEDFDFDYRATRAGFSVYSLPEPRIHLRARKTLRALAKQRWRYGYWKGRVIRKHPRSLKMRQLLPMLIPPALLIALVWPWWLVVVAMGYVAAGAGLVLFGGAETQDSPNPSLRREGSDSSPRPKRLAAWPIAAVALLIVHIVWAVGVWWGLARGMVIPRRSMAAVARGRQPSSAQPGEPLATADADRVVQSRRIT